MLDPGIQAGTLLAGAAIGIGCVLAVVGVRRALASRNRPMASDVSTIRAGIATDLHDDIGASLTHIAILSEVASREVSANPELTAERLSTIAVASRELVRSMGDVVWSIDPERDRIDELVRRMRRFASDMFAASDVAFVFRAPEHEAGTFVDGSIRRQLLLVFKEAVTNVVRHAHASNADVDLRHDGGTFVLTVRDDGAGFDAENPNEGNGLDSMRRRAERIGGSFHVESRAGGGTVVRVRIPIRSPA